MLIHSDPLPAFHWEGRKTSFNLEHVCTISSCLVSLYALELIVRDYLKIKSELWPGNSLLTYTQEMKNHTLYFTDITFYQAQWCSFAVPVIRNLKDRKSVV